MRAGWFCLAIPYQSPQRVPPQKMPRAVGRSFWASFVCLVPNHFVQNLAKLGPKDWANGPTSYFLGFPAYFLWTVFLAWNHLSALSGICGPRILIPRLDILKSPEKRSGFLTGVHQPHTLLQRTFLSLETEYSKGLNGNLGFNHVSCISPSLTSFPPARLACWVCTASRRRRWIQLPGMELFGACNMGFNVYKYQFT